MRILIVFNDARVLTSGTPEDLACEQESRVIAPLVRSALEMRGHSVTTLTTASSFWEDLRALEPPPELVFNLAEGFGGTNSDEPLVPAMLEALRIPFTGASAHNMYLTLDKEKTKLVARGYAIPTPPHQVLRSASEPLDPSLVYPLIVKPIRREASVGIHDANVVFEAVSLLREVRRLLEIYGEPVLVEEFIAGREISVGIVGNLPSLHVFPPLEFLFPGAPNPEEAIRSYVYKWGEKREVMVRARLEEHLSRELIELSQRAFAATECRDYARMDFRIDRSGRAYLLEVNYNPGIGPNNDELSNTLTMMASFEGHSFEDLVVWISEIAARRQKVG